MQHIITNSCKFGLNYIKKHRHVFLKSNSKTSKYIFAGSYLSFYYLACVEGFYGTNCSLRCPPNCIVCRHIDGHCSSCKERYHGRNCSLVCFPNCKSDTCQQTDSLCISDAGWNRDNCTKECEKTWYGVNCSQRCAGHCKDNDTCDHVTGQCAGGCDQVGQGLFVIEQSNTDV